MYIMDLKLFDKNPKAVTRGNLTMEILEKYTKRFYYMNIYLNLYFTNK